MLINIDYELQSSLWSTLLTCTRSLVIKLSIELQEAQVYAQENGLFFMETSAKTASNVNDIFYEIGMLLMPIKNDEIKLELN